MQRISAQIFLITVLAAAGAWGFPSPTVAQEPGAKADAAPSTADPRPSKADAEAKDKTAGDEAADEAAAKKKKSAEDISGGRFAGDPVYVHLSPMVLPVISDQGVEQLVTIIIDVEVKDFDVADNMHTNMPRVKDALMRALYGGLGQGSLRNGKLVNVNHIKAKATAALNEVVGDGIREVLIQGIAQRML